MLKDITKVAIYVRGLENAGLNANQMPLANLNREDLLEARKHLSKIGKYLPQLEEFGTIDDHRVARMSEKDKNAVISLREKVWYYSSRFYELIPQEQYID